MAAVLGQIASISVVVFAVSSMLTVGFAYRLELLLGPLREFRAVFRALVANFVMVPLLAIGIARLIPLDPPLALGLFLLAGSAGAPFLIKLASAARADIALSAALLLLLVPATVLFLPFYVPWAMEHPSLADLSYVPSSVFAIGVPLLTTLIAPLVLGLMVQAFTPRWAAWLAPIGSKISTVALVLVLVGSFGADLPGLLHIVRSGAIVAGLLLVLGAFVIGYLLSRRQRSVVLGLGTAQRNVAGAMVVATLDFTDPTILLMINATVLVGLLVLFPLATLLSKRAPRFGLATLEPSAA